jgi:hypothetical protein
MKEQQARQTEHAIGAAWSKMREAIRRDIDRRFAGTAKKLTIDCSCREIDCREIHKQS